MKNHKPQIKKQALGRFRGIVKFSTLHKSCPHKDLGQSINKFSFIVDFILYKISTKRYIIHMIKDKNDKSNQIRRDKKMEQINCINNCTDNTNVWKVTNNVYECEECGTRWNEETGEVY